MKIVTDEAKIDELLTRGVHAVFTKEELQKKLRSGKQLHLKLGTDVTGSKLHFGHAVVQRKIRDFQELGHRVTLIIGDFTTLVGDHSDKIDQREETTSDDIKKLEKTYQDQFFKTVIKKQTKIRHNSEWLKKLSFKDGINLSKLFTLQQMLDRETFKLRYQKGNPIDMDEFMYPLMQGYDSVALKADVEFGGTDQTFNLLAGRKLMQHFGLEPQSAVVMKLLVGSDGKPMGKSLKNFISIDSSADEMYGGVMSIIDEAIFDYFELVTRVPMTEIEKMKQEVAGGANPMNYKKKLAKEVVSFYHDKVLAEKAEENFVNTFKKGELPDDVISVEGNSQKLEEILLQTKIVASKSEFRRLLEEGAITNLATKEKLSDLTYIPKNGESFKIGKRRFIKIT
jgi:tyrosyl-tRNA synthetase